MKTKKKSATDFKPYVWECANFSTYKCNGNTVVVDADSEESASDTFIQNADMEYYGGHVRLAGDEVRIEAIQKYAERWFQAGLLDQQIQDLHAKEEALRKAIKDSQEEVFGIEQEIPF